MNRNINIQEFIDSGILEQYALGLTSASQNEEIAGLLKEYAELRKELKEIENSLELFASQYAKPMPDHLKEKIMKQIENERSNLNKQSGSGSSFLNYLLYLAVILFAVATVYFWNQSKQVSKELAEQISYHNQRESRYGQDSLWLLDCSNQLNDCRNKERHRILLKGTTKSPQSFAAVYYDTTGRKAFVDVMDLPTPPPEKQYQLWAIVSGKPVDLGLIDLVNNRSLILKSITYVENAEAFAVTLEPQGGKSSPTLEQMYLLGNR